MPSGYISTTKPIGPSAATKAFTASKVAQMTKADTAADHRSAALVAAKPKAKTGPTKAAVNAFTATKIAQLTALDVKDAARAAGLRKASATVAARKAKAAVLPKPAAVKSTGTSVPKGPHATPTPRYLPGPGVPTPASADPGSGTSGTVYGSTSSDGSLIDKVLGGGWVQIALLGALAVLAIYYLRKHRKGKG